MRAIDIILHEPTRLVIWHISTASWEVERSSACCGSSHELDSSKSVHWRGRGICHSTMGNLDLALQDLERAVELCAKRLE